MVEIEIHGDAETEFGPVADAFRANVDHGEVGAAVALVVEGRTVVDLWAGEARPGTPRGAWTADTLAVMFSCTKGVTAIGIYLLVQDGLLDLDDPVASIWPEFGAHGKDRVTVREALAHRAGVPVIDGPLTREQVLDWPTITSLLAAQRPLWKPGTGYQYHAVTYGWIAGEIIRRVSGLMPDAFLDQRLRQPLGLDLWVGLPEREHARVARILPPTPPVDPPPALDFTDEALAVMERAVSLDGGLGSWDDLYDDLTSGPLLSTPMPAANGVATARSLASLFAACVTGPARLLTPDSVTDATATVSTGAAVYNPYDEGRFGTGFGLATEGEPLLGPRSFGHGGAGGKMAFADDDAHVGFAYLNNWFGTDPDTRARDLIAAVRSSLG